MDAPLLFSSPLSPPSFLLIVSLECALIYVRAESQHTLHSPRIVAVSEGKQAECQWVYLATFTWRGAQLQATRWSDDTRNCFFISFVIEFQFIALLANFISSIQYVIHLYCLSVRVSWVDCFLEDSWIDNGNYNSIFFWKFQTRNEEENKN